MRMSGREFGSARGHYGLKRDRACWRSASELNLDTSLPRLMVGSQLMLAYAHTGTSSEPQPRMVSLASDISSLRALVKSCLMGVPLASAALRELCTLSRTPHRFTLTITWLERTPLRCGVLDTLLLTRRAVERCSLTTSSALMLPGGCR